MKKKKVRKVKLVNGDLAYIRGLTQKTRRPSSNLENCVPEISLVHGIASLYEERIAPPAVFVPTREYNQKNDDTPLPPENLQSGMRNLSIRAKLAWQQWTAPNGEPFVVDDVEYTPLQGTLEELMFDDYERETVLKYRADVAESEQIWETETTNEIHSITSVTPGFVHCQSGVIKRDPYNRTYADYMESVVRSDYETNIWRPSARKEQDHLIPNCGFRDDPDYIPPISNSGNFRLSPPANRMFNASFTVFLISGKKLKFGPSLPKGQKDYSDVSDIEYLLEQRGIFGDQIEKIVVDFARFETDLRVTYAEGPDPRNYKKIDPQGPAGMKLMQLLNDQPHLWVEYSWDYISHDDTTTKKVAYGFTTGKVDKVTYWIYLDDRYVKNGNGIVTSRKPLPKIRYDYLKDREGVKIPIIAYLGFHTSKRGMKSSPKYREENPDASMYVIENMTAELAKKGYVQVRETEDNFGLVSQMFLRKDALTKKDRAKFVLSDADWHKKYGAS